VGTRIIASGDHPRPDAPHIGPGVEPRLGGPWVVPFYTRRLSRTTSTGHHETAFVDPNRSRSQAMRAS